MATTNNPLAAADELRVKQEVENTQQEVGCRVFCGLPFARYALAIAVVIAGIVVIAATPKTCPSGFKDENCYVLNTGKIYPCNNEDLKECANKGPSTGAIAGGVILIVVGIVFSIVACCHQARCILPGKAYDNKVCMCC